MKRFLLFALVATMFAACVTDATQDVAVCIETPETLTVSFEEDSRIQLQNGKTVWTKGDLVSVFYRSNANQKWQYQGETGERNGTLKRVANAEATQELSNIVVIYPYNENYYINPRTCNVQASLPATQTYLADSYGLNGNIMVSQSEYNQIALKSVCGWLKLQLTGDGEVIKSIALKGNNGEQVAGEVYINSADATCVLAAENGVSNDDSVAGGNLVFDDTILTEVVLDCDEGVTLGAEATAFYIALPPQTFENGLTVTFTNTDGASFEKSTNKAVVIERNTIQPMEAFGAEFLTPGPANNEVWYTTTDGAKADISEYTAYKSNIYDEEKGVWIVTFNGDFTYIPSESTLFNRNHSLRINRIYLPGCLQTINGYAFADYFTNLEEINIPDGVKSIDREAFRNCSSLKGLTIPSSVTSIGERAFVGCSGEFVINCNMPDYSDCPFYGSTVTSVYLGNGVTEIGNNALPNALADNQSLLYLHIPEGVTRIGDCVLYQYSIESIILPSTLKVLGRNNFRIKNMYFKGTTPPTIGSAEYTGNIYVPVSDNHSVLNAYKEAFSMFSSYCKFYEYDFEKGEVVVPDPIPANNEIWYTTTTGEKASLFQEESMISRFNITAHTYDEANGVWVLRTGNERWTEFPNIDTNLFNNPSVVNSVYMPNCIETINGALRGTIIASIKLPTNLKSIGDRTFAGCAKLESVTIPNGVTSIGNNAFAMCTSLKNLEIPNSVATFNLDCIGGGYYENMGTRLTKLTIGRGVTEITGRYRMEFGGVISELYLKPNTPPTNIKALFYDVSSFETKITSRMKIYVPIGSEEAYKQALTWENYSLDSIIIGVNF